MADPLQNAAFLQQLFRPVSDVGQGFGESNVKAATLGYQDNLRQIKQAEDDADAARDFEYRKALTNLTIAGQERIAREQTNKTITATGMQTDRALAQQREMTDRAVELATAKELAAAKAQYRLMAGKDAKAISEFGDTPDKQLDGINQELATLNDAKAKSAATLYLRTQKALDDEMQRITTVTDKDEASLVANAMGNITSKDVRDKLAKFKGATNSASILTFLNTISPASASEFSAGYEGAKDAIINNRSKGSKISALQRDLQYKSSLLKDPNVLNYVALGLNDDTSASAPATPKAPATLDELFGNKATPIKPSAVVPLVTPTVPQSPRSPPMFSGVPDTSGVLSNNRRHDAVRDILMSGAQSVGNFLTPANWRTDYRPGSIIPVPDSMSFATPQEDIVKQLMSRLSGMTDPTSPRSADIRSQLYDLTSPAAYINSRPSYFAGSR